MEVMAAHAEGVAGMLNGQMDAWYGMACHGQLHHPPPHWTGVRPLPLVLWHHEPLASASMRRSIHATV